MVLVVSKGIEECLFTAGFEDLYKLDLEIVRNTETMTLVLKETLVPKTPNPTMKYKDDTKY